MLFDLNIKKILTHWSVIDALREIIANAIDEKNKLEEQKSSECNIEIYNENGILSIKDNGRGLKIDDFVLNENDEKLKSNKSIGKFGVGLKDALAVLFNNDCSFEIFSNDIHVTGIVWAFKKDCNVRTLHLEYEKSKDNVQGTHFKIKNIKDEDIEIAKSKFLCFEKEKLTCLEKTDNGEVYKNKNKNLKFILMEKKLQVKKISCLVITLKNNLRKL